MARGHIYGVVAPAMHAVAARARLHERALRQAIVVRRVRIPSGLGLRIVLAADVHADRRSMPRERVRAIVDLVEAVEDVDLVAMPGDFVGHEVAMVDDVAAELERLRVPVFATLGNHDHMEGPERVAQSLRAAGVRVLVDQAIELDAQRRPGVWVAGLDSCIAGVAAMGVIERMLPDDARCIVLGHEPFLATRHDQLLHLAGHTHHGQVRIPGVPVRFLPRYSRPYPEGLAVVDGPIGARYVYTTAGLGSTTLPLRIGAPPEIVVLDT